jgi:hypothetical protein
MFICPCTAGPAAYKLYARLRVDASYVISYFYHLMLYPWRHRFYTLYPSPAGNVYPAGPVVFPLLFSKPYHCLLL